MAPRVAIAGGGSFSRYLVDELTNAGFDKITIMGRSKKAFFEDHPNITQRVVDYTSVESIQDALGDNTEVLLSTILDYSMDLDVAQRNMITAAMQSPRTRRFIPSEYGGNLEDYPDQTPFYLANRGPTREILRNQSTLEWTLTSTSWFVDYIVPERQRYFVDIGDAFPVNLKDGNFFIQGAGIEMIDVVSARDVAKGVVELLNAPYGTWEPYTYFSGEKTCWNAITEKVRHAYPDIDFKRSSISLTQMIDNIVNAKDEEEKIMAQYQVFGVSGAGNFDAKKVEAQRAKYFKNVHFRTVQEILDESKRNPDSMI